MLPAAAMWYYASTSTSHHEARHDTILQLMIVDGSEYSSELCEFLKGFIYLPN